MLPLEKSMASAIISNQTTSQKKKKNGTPSKLIEGYSTLEETFNKFDEKLRKLG